MSCPTCDHTMQGLTGGEFWCPRCGTITHPKVRHAFTYPILVSRVRDFLEKKEGRQAKHIALMDIEECVYLPRDRLGGDDDA